MLRCQHHLDINMVDSLYREAVLLMKILVYLRNSIGNRKGIYLVTVKMGMWDTRYAYACMQ